jgi:hypothetical protein
MANTHFATQSTLGVDATSSTTNAMHDLGTKVNGTEGSEFVYVQANGAITGDGYVCLVDESFQADMIDTTNSASAFGEQVGVAKHAFADNEYGWVQIAGTANIQVAASAAANAALNTTATSGQLDDDGTSGAETVDGIIINTANGGSAGTVEGYIVAPKVGATL